MCLGKKRNSGKLWFQARLRGRQARVAMLGPVLEHGGEAIHNDCVQRLQMVVSELCGVVRPQLQHQACIGVSTNAVGFNLVL
jgi:hypothetical protein